VRVFNLVCTQEIDLMWNACIPKSN